MIASNARHTHLEMGDTPIIDHGAYVMLGNDELFLRMLAQGTDFERIRDYVGWTINATKALGVKVVNPGGISAFKFNQRSLDVDEAHVHYDITPRQVLNVLARSLHRSRRAASAAYSCEQPGRAGQHRIDARHDRCARRPARSPHAHPVPQLRQRRAAQVFFGGRAYRGCGQRESEHLDRRRPDHVRPDGDRFWRHHEAGQAGGLRSRRASGSRAISSAMQVAASCPFAIASKAT